MSNNIIGLEVPDFSLPATGGEDFRLSARRGNAVVIYFYPKDNTPGCTTEAGQFRDMHGEFTAAGAVLFGVSRDSLRSHEGFKARLRLPFELIADTEELACNLFGVMTMKKMYGKEVRGVERSTFLIDRHGILRQEWRAVKADGHAAEVLAAVKAL
ncbi:MAG: peroxiredoxin [Rhodocyclaceae bacterium]|nr:peroxiredoxin [Rhodocyclaceae bacterium]